MGTETANMEHFVMAEVTEKKVVYEVGDIPDVEVKEEEKEQKKTVVEFWRAKKEEKQPDGVTTKDVLNYVDASMDVVKGCLKIGAFAVPEVAPVLLALAGVAGFIQGALKLVPDDTPDPVDEKMKELEKTIHELEKQMNSNFADLKSFITEVEFTIEITNEASTLHKYMRDVLKYRTPESVQNFREAYEKSSPLLLSYALITLLEQRSTNPVRMEMESEKVKTKATFKKWEKVIDGVLGQFLFIEAFASGLFKKKNPYNWERIIERSKKVPLILKEIREEFEKDESYWEDVKKDFEDYIKNHTHLSNQQKAQEIAAKLEKYLTSDAFHVVVFNESTWQHDYTYHCPNEKTQIIGAWNKGKCCAFIYRSREGNQMSKSDYENVRDQINNLREKKIELSFFNPMLTMIQKQMLDPKLVRGDGLICLIDDNRIPFIEVANCPQFVKGPGNWELIYLDVRITTIKDDLRKKTMLVSFP
uniref:TPR_REGION domain-containing protein n=1 Tax=Caenorhabditis tropicalis TaxID=1561998 RepID=A0A1I7ULH6_9PELO